ncbi:MOLPALP family lipoprotein [Mycoplasma feriruminatoris]|uniref:MOLPALP family lipoprotein n=1 Tax=Mycoplasma feriruminatoris TaxID=1179777 RepID=A0ABY8HX74_9MOLU|nr:MOLPALP family lipoprotein [Mycoplasma feriruminatoris]WFQ93400.1 MOLPALP family lipoprotein [Mycoplasma feriruminatoris]
MKKLIAILSSMMMITTASLPIIACHTKEHKFENNNSITNTQTSASLFAKELILADQLGINLKEIQNRNQQKDLALLLDETNLKLDNNDSNIKNISSSNDLINQYFEKDSYKNKDVLDSKIKLDTQKKLDNPLFKLLGLSITDSDKFIDDITNLLTLLVNLNPMFISSNFDQSNTTLQSFFKNIKPSLKTLFNSISNSKDVVKNVKEFQEKLDVNVKYKDLKVEDLDIAFYTSLINAIGSGLNQKEFKVVEIDTNNINKTLDNTAEMLTKLISSPAKSNQGKEWDIILYTLQALQFIQLKFSLFENIKSHTPTSANNLFDANKTNQEFLTELYKGKTIESITEKKPSSINLKYILSFFKSAVNELKDEKKLDGYELQKLLAMLFLSPEEVKYGESFDKKDKEQVQKFYKEQKAHPSISLLTAVIKDLLSKNLKNFIKNSTDEKIKKFIDELIPHIYKWLSYSSNNLLTGQHNAYQTLSSLFAHTIPAILISLKENTNLLKEIADEFVPLVSSLVFAFLSEDILQIAFPMFNKNDKNSFKTLYSGELFLIDKVDEMFSKFKEEAKNKITEIAKLVPTIKLDVSKIDFDVAKPYLDIFKGVYDQIFKNVKHFNLKTLLNTPINKIDPDSWKDKNFSKQLQNKSIADILDTLLNALGVKGNEKLADLSSSNINLTGLTDVASLIENYTYKVNGIDYKNKTQLLDILKDNSDKTLEILGWTSDSKNPIGKGSLIDVFLSKVFNFKTNQNTDKSENAINQLAKLVSLTNSSLDDSFDYENIDIQFEFTDTKKNNKDQLISETLVAKVKNKTNNTESKYSFSYSRDKQSKFKFTKITKN